MWNCLLSIPEYYRRNVPIFKYVFCFSPLVAICTYIKYVEVQSFTQANTSESRVSHTFNKVALSIGLTSCVGLDIVANFQESNVIAVHLLGAVLCFAAGTIYFILQVSAFTTLLWNWRTFYLCFILISSFRRVLNVACNLLGFVLSFIWVKVERYISLYPHIIV
jgi:ABC-type nickel/cobalt efflux system permease component RcnA